ncbi:MAG: PhoH family protein [Alphaproteobacteria bacterium]|nr:PhoH family protein [Alphaproteobacteria bacterium]MBV8548390.1 PhoH family protein [Alphaproteobacteria bacterium]
MSKRRQFESSNRNDKYDHKGHDQKHNVEPIYSSGSPWDPLNQPAFDRRDQSYTRKIKPQNANQAALFEAMAKNSLVVACGPAGTGKTYLAITAAVEAMEAGKVDRIILSRPAVEAGETIGFLPGDLQEKMAPFLRPLYDALNDRLGGKRLKQYLADGAIEIAPIGYMRGRTLNNAFVVIDEAQNCTYNQIKMLLTRLGWHSTMVLTGDPDQSDLLEGMSGFADIARKLEQVSGIAVVRLTEKDIVRHPLVASMLGVL